MRRVVLAAWLGMLAVRAGAAGAPPAPAPAPAQDPWRWFVSAPAGSTPDLRRRAASGDARAEIALARQCHSRHDGTCTILWLTEANARGDAVAQYLLGMVYVRGDGITQDLQQGAYFLGKAAAQHEVHAEYRLGLMLSDADFTNPGAGSIPDELRRGERLLRAAAAAGYAPAQYRMGVLCARLGADCAAQSRAWLERAAAQGQIDAAYMVAAQAARSGDVGAARSGAQRVLQLAPAGSSYAGDARRLLQRLSGAH